MSVDIRKLFLLSGSIMIAMSSIAQKNTAQLTVVSDYLDVRDTLELYVWRDLIGSEINAPHDIISMVQDGHGTYRADIASMNTHTHVSLYFSYQKSMKIPMFGIFSTLPLRPGDDITIELFPKTGRYKAAGMGYDNGEPVFLKNWFCVFSGVGGKRMHLDYEMTDIYTNITYAPSPKEQKVYIESKWYKIDSLTMEVDQLISRAALQLDTQDADRLLENAKVWAVLSKVEVLKEYRMMSLMNTVRLDTADFLGLIDKMSADVNQLTKQYNLSIARNFRSVKAGAMLAEYSSIMRRGVSGIADMFSETVNLFGEKIMQDRIIANLIIDHFSRKPDGLALEKIMEGIYDPYALKRIQEKGIFVPGNAFPEFSLPDISGKKHNLSDYKGKLVLLDFWYMGCIPCRYFIKNEIKPLAESGIDIEILLISTDTRKVLEKAIIDDVIPSSVIALYTEDQGFKHPYIGRLGISGYPYPVLLDGKGKVLLVGNQLKNERLIDIIRRYKNSGE
ncbi:TlpA family protein disulfide reductase [Parapedobacter sp. SGR-10]|uniref:TlpA family protein disulfide reductase n=1 Tax=Parapedobacter sp. SGR-10 TaxID=2710879 RepID=UPI0013D88A48|nr:TlpA disulfide reductase family protein [Parapedobacter sp. SGR-10]NGF55396.1 TlpA family protein disulfide reductase [Parapedobacter sp. SGR-10]